MVKRILIADEYEAILRGLRASLEANPEWKICGDAVDGQEAIAKAVVFYGARSWLHFYEISHFFRSLH